MGALDSTGKIVVVVLSFGFCAILNRVEDRGVSLGHRVCLCAWKKAGKGTVTVRNDH